VHYLELALLKFNR